jgi:hypothetical protein
MQHLSLINLILVLLALSLSIYLAYYIYTKFSKNFESIFSKQNHLEADLNRVKINARLSAAKKRMDALETNAEDFAALAKVKISIVDFVHASEEILRLKIDSYRLNVRELNTNPFFKNVLHELAKNSVSNGSEKISLISSELKTRTRVHYIDPKLDLEDQNLRQMLNYMRTVDHNFDYEEKSYNGKSGIMLDFYKKQQRGEAEVGTLYNVSDVDKLYGTEITAEKIFSRLELELIMQKSPLKYYLFFLRNNRFDVAKLINTLNRKSRRSLLTGLEISWESIYTKFSKSKIDELLKLSEDRSIKFQTRHKNGNNVMILFYGKMALQGGLPCPPNCFENITDAN